MESAEAILAEIDVLSSRDHHLIAGIRGDGVGANAERELLAALLDAARALDEARIPYALIGGLAVGVHTGSPRATIDVDLAATLEVGRAKVAQALEGAGFRKTGDFEHSINFRHASGEPLQVAFDPEFDAMVLRAERFDVADTSVCIVTRSDLIAMKERAAADVMRRKSKRLRDRADVEMLKGDVPDPDEGW